MKTHTNAGSNKAYSNLYFQIRFAVFHLSSGIPPSVVLAGTDSTSDSSYLFLRLHQRDESAYIS